MQAFHSLYNTGPQACEALKETRGSRTAPFVMASVILHLLALLACAHWTRSAASPSLAGDAVIQIDLMSIPVVQDPAPAPTPVAAVPAEESSPPAEAAESREGEITAPVKAPAPPVASMKAAPPEKAVASAPQPVAPQEKVITTADTPPAPPSPPPEAQPATTAAAPDAGMAAETAGRISPSAPALPGGASEPHPTGTDAGSGTGASPAQYVEENFYYIKDLITRNLSYPVVARRMKWQGTVVVSFVVCEDGCVKEMRVAESSGHPVLDRNTLATIESVQPFPAPPAAAEFSMPIKYTLKK